MNDELLTTRDAARLLGVSPSTVKRWSEQGLLACEHTAGGHRRFRLSAIHALTAASERGASASALGASGADGSGDFPDQRWMELALLADHGTLVAELQARRAATGSWWQVAEAMGRVLRAIGHAWASGALSVVDEHVASERLRRALVSCVEAIETPPDSPRALLATASGEDHDLGLVLAELVLREAGWRVVWSGRRSPAGDLAAHVRRGDVAMAALSASAYATDVIGLGAEADALAAVCREQGAVLVLGGSGHWPDPPPKGAVRAHSFGDLVRWLEARHAEKVKSE